jgi:hypothetical protein
MILNHFRRRTSAIRWRRDWRNSHRCALGVTLVLRWCYTVVMLLFHVVRLLHCFDTVFALFVHWGRDCRN